jgi:hypothetical protein
MLVAQNKVTHWLEQVRRHVRTGGLVKRAALDGDDRERFI